MKAPYITKVLAEFGEMKKEAAALSGGGSPAPDYYERHDEFRKRLRAFLSLDFRALDGADMLALCAMVGTFRPVALHSFFTTCAILIESPKGAEERTAAKFQ